MTTRREHPERYGWWINELESLGVGVKKTNEFNDLKEIRSLAEIIKYHYYHYYQTSNNSLLFYVSNYTPDILLATCCLYILVVNIHNLHI